MPESKVRYARFLSSGMIESWGLVRDDSIVRLEGAPYDGAKISKDEFSIKEVAILAPCEPSKIVAVGLNYKDHARELGMTTPEEPIIFLKPPTALAADGDIITIPKISKQVDYEAELAIVIGRTAKNVAEEDADRYILGYTCANDITARDLQRRDGQWTRAKSFDKFCPLGPFITTEKPASNAKITLKKNGEIKQRSTLDQMVFSIDTIISFISRIMTLKPGDLILTGTPPGIGPVADGDDITVEIEGLGTLTNKFALEK